MTGIEFLIAQIAEHGWPGIVQIDIDPIDAETLNVMVHLHTGDGASANFPNRDEDVLRERIMLAVAEARRPRLLN